MNLPSNRSPDPNVHARTFFRRWLLVGLALCACVPSLRGAHPLIGWWPLWLVLMPSMALVALARTPGHAWTTMLAAASRRPQPLPQAVRRRALPRRA